MSVPTVLGKVASFEANFAALGEPLSSRDRK